MHFKIKIFTRILLTALLAVAEFSCKKEKITDDTYFGSKVMILGHRGMGSYYKIPGDTYESIVPAIGIGVDGCEIDLHMTKDTALILYHDHTLNPGTTCNGTIYDITLDEVKKCKYYGLKNNVFVCSAEDVFSQLPNLNELYFSFDCKLDYNVPNYQLYKSQFIRAIKRLYEKYNMANNIFIEGQEDFLLEARKNGITSKLFLSGALNMTNINIAVKDTFFGLVSQIDDFEVDADSAHVKGLYVMGYTPYNYYLNISMIRKKIDIVQTDDPISILKEFGRFNYEYVIP